MKTWNVYATKVVVMGATFSVKAENKDDAWDAAEHYADHEVLSWEDTDPRGGGQVEVQDVEEEKA
tara:strand:+ start:211 stop:405 length:195 start_codon:yes stop_codon:yes gene_type:complete